MPLNIQWPVPSRFPVLNMDEGHVWAVPTDVQQCARDRYLELLSADELDRWKASRRSKSRNVFLVVRGVLRTLLGAYLHRDPAQLQFCYGAQGKPQLKVAIGMDTMQFNVSHSGALALIAVSWNHRLGVDLEELQDSFPVTRVAKRFFSSAENSVLHQIPLDQRVSAFFNCWTRKEAYVKAIGQGLAVPLNQITVSLQPGNKAELLATPHDPGQLHRWRLHALFPANDYVAALAVKQRLNDYTCWQWKGIRLRKRDRVPHLP